jgi:hypothetical protein
MFIHISHLQVVAKIAVQEKANGSESESCKFIAHQVMELREGSIFMFEHEAG